MLFESLRGPNVVDVWKSLADELHGSFENSGHFHPEMVIVVQLENTHIALDNPSAGFGNNRTDCTRMRAPCMAHEGSWMSVEPSSFVGRTLRKFTGKSGMQVEDAAFDSKHVVDGSSAAFVRDLLADQSVRCRLTENPFQFLRVGENDPLLIAEGARKQPAPAVLTLQILGLVKDKERLRGYFSMFNAVLSRLSARQAAAPDEKIFPAERPRLEAMKNTIDRELSWLSATTERTSAGNETRLRFEHGADAFTAGVEVSTPKTPHLHCDVTLHAPMPVLEADFDARKASGLADALVNLSDTKIGHAIVDEAFVIKASASGASQLNAFAPALVRLQEVIGHPRGLQVQVVDGNLRVHVADIHAEAAATAVIAVAEFWNTVGKIACE